MCSRYAVRRSDSLQLYEPLIAAQCNSLQEGKHKGGPVSCTTKVKVEGEWDAETVLHCTFLLKKPIVITS